jgi:hypothetical protein
MIDLHFVSDTTLDDVAMADQGHWSSTADAIGPQSTEREDCTVAPGWDFVPYRAGEFAPGERS